MLKSNWKSALAVIIAVIALCFCLFRTPAEAPEITPVKNISVPELKTAFPYESNATIKDMAHQMQRAKETQAPQYHYYTVTQKEADHKAQEYAKAQKADKLIKETHETKVKDDLGKETSVIENDYYAINLERKHKVKAGAAMIDHEAYITVGYQNRDIEYKAYYAPTAKKAGVGVEVTIAKW